MDEHLKKAFERLRDPERVLRKEYFKTGNRCFIQRRKDEMKAKDRRLARTFIRPENGDVFLDALPGGEGDVLHAVTCGDFVMGDFLCRLVERFGCPRTMTLATLSLSLANVDRLAQLMERFVDLRLDLLLSHYFQNTNGDVFRGLEEKLVKGFPDRFRVGVARSHAKIFLFDYEDRSWVFESSANLRSSGNVEQVVVCCDRELLDFHRTWILELFE